MLKEHKSLLHKLKEHYESTIALKQIHNMMDPQTPWKIQMWIGKWKQRKKELAYAP
jgi:hypothetical protein